MSEALGLFDEIVVTKLPPVEDAAATEMREAIEEFLKSAERFRELNSHNMNWWSVGDPWWKAMQWLTISDTRLKQAFCGDNRSRSSIRLYHEYRQRLLVGVPYRTNA
jgi:hypothetical protein